MITALVFVAALSSPNPALTPGVIRPLNGGQICGTAWGKDHRHVTRAMKQHVFALYSIPWSEHAKYEVDHREPRSLAGADDVRNLWPQLWAEAHLKDRLEVKLWRMVCSGSMTLADAQAVFLGDWIAAYQKYVR